MPSDPPAGLGAGLRRAAAPEVSQRLERIKVLSHRAARAAARFGEPPSEWIYWTVQAGWPGRPESWQVGADEHAGHLAVLLDRLGGSTGVFRVGAQVRSAPRPVILVTADGAEVRLPAAATMASGPEGLEVRLCPLATGADRSWISWQPVASPAPGPWGRIYLSLRPDDAHEHWAALMSGLWTAGIAVPSKIAVGWQALQRCDNAVVALPAQGQAAQVLEAVRSALPQGALRAEAPLLSCPVAPGIGVAETPQDSRASYGQVWSRRLADALHAPGDAAVDGVLEGLRLAWQRTARCLGSSSPSRPIEGGRS